MTDLPTRLTDWRDILERRLTLGPMPMEVGEDVIRALAADLDAAIAALREQEDQP